MICTFCDEDNECVDTCTRCTESVCKTCIIYCSICYSIHCECCISAFCELCKDPVCTLCHVRVIMDGLYYEPLTYGQSIDEAVDICIDCKVTLDDHGNKIMKRAGLFKIHLGEN